MAASLPVIAVTGLLAEARIASGVGVLTIAGGGDAARLHARLEAALMGGARGIISIGIAGALRPGLRPGTALIARSVVDGSRRCEADPDWAARLETALPDAVLSDLAGVDRAACRVEDKSALLAVTGAAAVDMESHVAARLAALFGVPFAALRIVADPCHRAIPEAAAVGMRPDGSADIAAVLRALRRRPADLPGLLRAALDANMALKSLARRRRCLTPALNFDAVRQAARTGSRAASGLEMGLSRRPAVVEGPADAT